MSDEPFTDEEMRVVESMQMEVICREDGLAVVHEPLDVPDAPPTCLTYIEAPSLDHLCVGEHEGHRCRQHHQGMRHLRITGEGYSSICRCACGEEWPT